MSTPIRFYTDYDGNQIPVYCEDETTKFGPVAVRTIPTNPNCRYFVSKLTLGDNYCSWQQGRGFSDYGELSQKWAIVELLSQIPGVESIHAHNAYSLMISKPETWEWEEIQPKVIEILQQFNAGAQ